VTEQGYTYVALFHFPHDGQEECLSDEVAIKCLAEALQHACDDGYFGGNFLIVDRYEDTRNHFWNKWRQKLGSTLKVQG
jgi:hypothetical protein